jgi:3-deoxy-D-arabino-heptulosonate 7-phosphate (DAHP) synthase
MANNEFMKIIAGPCSIDQENIDDIYKIAELKIDGKYVIWGTRVVGLKSRTNFIKNGEGMGIDFKDYLKNLNQVMKNKNLKNLKNHSSVKLAEKIYKDTNFLIATEIMDPFIQPLLYEGIIPQNKLLLWNPAVHQLGWQILIMSKFIKRNKWFLGIKNPKWLGDYLKRADRLASEFRTTAEKTWEGLVNYSNLPKERTILIHRGFDVPEKKKYRNAPAHFLAARVKKHTGCLLFFDPSHSYGPQMRGDIVKETIKAMKMKINENEYLYDGILIETGRSKTDTEQHISVEELKILCEEIGKFRVLDGR